MNNMTSEDLNLHFQKEPLKQQVLNFEEYIQLSKKMISEYENKIRVKFNTNRANNVPDEQDTTSDDFYIAEIYKKTTFEMIIVANYRLCELTLKKLLCTRFNEDEITDLKFSGLKSKFKPNLDIPSLSNYNDVDELRLLNNCIKHNGKVNSQLDSTTRNSSHHWIEDDEITIDENTIDRLYKASKTFLLEVIEKFS